MEPFQPYRAPRAPLAIPNPAPVSDIPRQAWAFVRVFPLLACALIAFVAGLMACYGVFALVLFGVEWLTTQPEPARVALLASRSGLTATAILVTSGWTAGTGIVATRRWDACRWRAALIASGGMILGTAATLVLATRL